MISNHPKSVLIAVVRHGTTDWNLERRIQGRSNNSLNQQGIKDAQTAVVTLQHYAKSALLAGVDEEQFCWRGITTSPLARAAATARLIADGLNGLPIGVDSELIERDYGSAEGLPVSKANALWPELVIPDAETAEELKSRAAATLKRHLFTYPATILVTHGAWMVTSTFADFARIYPERFTNVTNGITPRRWIGVANPELSALFDKYIGSSWRKDLAELTQLKSYIQEPALKQAISDIKRDNKAKLAAYVKQELGVEIDPNALFDVQVKRIHEYKRQILNVLHIIARYNAMIANPEKDWVPRVFILAGKAASAYYAAKQTIHLINDVANVINQDERLKGRLKVVFIPNYSVSLAELIIPAADISEQISLAGTEASGTSNMKFALNGALTLGTLDGANVEILANVGEENVFIFGNTVEQVEELRRNGYHPFSYYQNDEQLRNVVDQIMSGRFSPKDPSRYHSLMQSLQSYDYYQAFADFRSYVETQHQVDEKYKNQNAWVDSALQNIVNMSFFSSDRTIKEYAEKIWQVEPLKVD